MICLYIIVFFALFFVGFAAASRFLWHRSAMSALSELILRLVNIGRSDSPEKAEAIMKKRAAEEDKPFELPLKTYLSKAECREMHGCRMLIFSGSDDPDRIVLYLHGGAYVNEINPAHILFCDKLAKEVNAAVYAPVYPLAPNHTYAETYRILESFYRDLQKDHKPVTLMGDSAGGGLAAAFSEYLAGIHLPEPEHLILFSPWVDVSMSGNYEAFVNADPVLGAEELRRMGEVWAGDLDPKDHKVSPLFGDVSGLPDTLIFTGTREIFYPDITAFFDKLKAAGVKAELIVGENMNHVYPLYPIPEAKSAVRTVVKTILGEINHK